MHKIIFAFFWVDLTKTEGSSKLSLAADWNVNTFKVETLLVSLTGIPYSMSSDASPL